MTNLKALSLTILLGLILVLPAPFAAAKTFRIAQISDCHLRGDGLHNNQLQAVIDEINSSVPKLDFVLSTGDYTDWGTADQFERYQQVISSLTVPIYTAIGNHEVKWSPWAKTGQERFLDQKLYYSFDHEGIHFIAMDSTIWLEHNSFIDPLELQWLKKDLRKTGTKMPVVIFYHHCPNYVTNESALLDILKPYNVKLALVGHEHVWDTYVRNGIQFQLAMNCYPDPGNYRIVEFDDSTIKSYRKVVGKVAVPDGEFTLSPVKNPVRLISPSANKHLNASFEAVAESEVPMQKFEFAVDGAYQTASRSDDGRYHATFGEKIIPGHHIVTARGTDASGGEWLQSASVTVGDTEREAWRFKAKGAVQRSVTVKDGRLFFGCTGGNVYSLDAATGKQIWKSNAGSDVISKMAVENGTVFFGNTDGEIIALSAETGNRIWANKFAGPVQASPVVENGIVYTGAGNGGFYAIDAATGRVIWSDPTGGMIQETPLIFRNKVYFGNWNMQFHSLDTGTGKTAWTRQIGKWWGYSPACSDPATDGKNIFFTTIPMYDKEPDIYCVDPDTGNTVWSYQVTGGENGCGQSSPCVKGDSVFVETVTGYVVRLSALDGKEIWRAKVGQKAGTNSPISANGKIFACGQGGMLTSFDEMTGRTLWSYSTGTGYIFGSPTYWNGNIYVPSLDGSVTCIREEMP